MSSEKKGKDTAPHFLIVQPQDKDWDFKLDVGDEATLVPFSPSGYGKERPVMVRVSRPESRINIRGENHSLRIIDLPIESSSFTFDFGSNNSQPPLTPELLSSSILPVLSALCEVERIINSNLLVQPRIVAITQSSPVNVSMTGIPEAYKALRDDIIPWRRNHQKEISSLLEQEKQAEIEQKRADVAEATARTKKEMAEAEKIRAESKQIEAEVQQKQFKLQKEKIEFVYTLVEKMAPEASHVERLTIFKDLLPHIETLALTEAGIAIADNNS